MVQNEIIESRIKNAAPFVGCPPDIIQGLLKNAALQNHKKGRLLFIHEDPADRYYFVVKGWVKLFRETLDGTQAVVDILGAGCFLGSLFGRC